MSKTAQTVKVGPKNRHMTIPDGWERVLSGPARQNDMYADLCHYRFMNVEEEDLLFDAETFDCLIRRKGQTP